MNTTATANWPLFATNQDNRVDRIDRIDIQVNGQPNDPLKNFNKMIAQNNINSNISPNLSNDYQKPDDLSVNSQLHRNHQQTHNNENKQQPQQQSHVYGNRNGKLIDVSADGSHDEFDDEDMDDDVGSIDDVDSLSSHDNIYDTSYNSNDSNRNDSNERFSAANSKDDISNDEQKVNDDQAIGPLAQLQNAVERRTGILGMRLTDFSTPNGTTPSLFGGGINFSANSINPIGMSSLQYSEDKNGEVYRCHLCSYSGTSKDHFNVHMDTHFDHKCPYCDYTSRTEGRLKRHIRDFHSENPPESWAGTRVLKESTSNDGDDSADPNDGSGGNGGSGSKSRKYKCKQCEFVATCKQEFWEHSKSHIKAEKLLTCPKCNFVTEYKHHLEYHLRNHFGSKPFKCGKCNYSCVNKSMLNSHMKSHSNIYQYRCADCSYATKYCHSLKLHLRKYSHKPATVLNLDGTPNPYPVIDVYGTRRGPRPKRPKNREHHYNHHNERSLSATQTPILTSPISPNLVNTAIPPLIPTSMPMGLPFIYPPTATTFGLLGPQAIPQIPHMPNNHQMPHHLYEQSSHSSHSAANTNLQCNLCDFSTNIREQFGRHLLIHVSNENKEFYKMYGTDQTQMIQHNAIINELVARQSPNSKKFLEQIAINPAFINTLMSMNSLPKSEPMMALEWHSPKGSTDIHDNNGTPSPHNTIMNFKDNRSESDQMESQRLNEMISPLSSNSTAEHEKYIKQKVLSDERKRVVHMETVPLDLSSTKSTSPLTNDNMFISHLPFMERKHDRTPPSDVTAQQQQQHHSPPPQQHSRANRRKGRAYKLNVNRISLHTNDDHFNSVELTDDDVSHSSESIREDSDHESIANESVFNTNFQVQLSVNNTTKSVGDLLSKEGKEHKEEYTCNACEITFKDSIMYTMHIGYHDHNDPYTCNSCGQHFSDKFSFYVHLHRASHK